VHVRREDDVHSITVRLEERPTDDDGADAALSAGGAPRPTVP
jgi:hypothetical protein